MENAFQGQYDQMQADIDGMAGNVAAAGGPLLPPLGLPPVDPAAMQQMMQAMMQMMMASLQQAAAAASGTVPLAASSPLGGTHWTQNTQMANVRLDERAFRRLDKFSNKKDEWKE